MYMRACVHIYIQTHGCAVQVYAACVRHRHRHRLSLRLHGFIAVKSETVLCALDAALLRYSGWGYRPAGLFKAGGYMDRV